MDDRTLEKDRCLQIIRGTLATLEETRRPGVQVNAENVLKVIIGSIEKDIDADVYVSVYRKALFDQLGAAGLK